MSIVVYIESQDGQIKKTSLEAASMAYSLSQDMGSSLTAIIDGEVNDTDSLSVTGVTEVVKISSTDGVAQVASDALASVIEEKGGKVFIAPHSVFTEGVIARLSIKLGGTAITNILGKPDVSSGFKVRKSVYTSKAFVNLNVRADVKVLTMKKGSFEVGTESSSVSVSDHGASSSALGGYKVVETIKQEGDILLPEADLVVSAGRGLKGPENWGMIEELAGILGAATACSKPVSDTDWRPHHEHVGQTGIKVSPNLYIAVGISGAIQHLAGVSSSKVIVVINTDEEAPFFKAADYGIVGDAFEVVPKLIEALKN